MTRYETPATPVGRLLAFGAVLVVVLATGLLVGTLVGPVPVPVPATQAPVVPGAPTVHGGGHG